MNQTTKNWIIKAENDLKTAKILFNSNEKIVDNICFHCQQAVEKYLKAFLVYNQREFRKTHNIEELIEICNEIDTDFEKLHDINLEDLTTYAIGSRYPDDFDLLTIEEAKEAIELTERAKEFVLKKLVEKGYKE